MPHRVLYRRVGLRGEALILFGAIWVLIGVGVALRASSAPPAALWDIIPAPAQMGLWIVPGLLAILPRVPWM